MNISVVIPAYNEEQRIESSLKQIIKYLGEHFSEYEIIIVDDGSSDKTSEVASKYKDHNVRILRNEVNKGKGYSVKIGVLNSRFPLVLFSDSDMATPIEELKGFIDCMGDNYHIVIASRNLNGSDIKNKQPVYRQIMGKIFPEIVNLLLLKGFKDTQCGFKLFKTDVAKRIFQLQTIERFSFDVEMLYIAKKMGYAVKEAPVVWIDKEGSTVRTFSDGFRMLIDIFKVRFNNLRGKYDVEHINKF